MTDRLSLSQLRALYDPKPPATTLQRAAQRGKLDAVKWGRDWYVTPESYLAYVAGWPHMPYGHQPKLHNSTQEKGQ